MAGLAGAIRGRGLGGVGNKRWRTTPPQRGIVFMLNTCYGRDLVPVGRRVATIFDAITKGPDRQAGSVANGGRWRDNLFAVSTTGIVTTLGKGQ